MPSVEREKRASQLGNLYLPTVLPSGPNQVRAGELAHISGHYAGIVFPSYVTLVASGPSTRDNTHLSLKNGIAFADILGVDLSPYLDHLLAVWDSTGRMVQGWIKAAGTGETLSAESFDNPAFSAVGNWLMNASWSVGGGVASLAVGSPALEYIYQLISGLDSTVIKYKVDVTVFGSGLLRVIAGSSTIIKNIATGLGNDQVAYVNAQPATVVAYGFVDNANVADNYTIDNASLTQVLTPSTTGVTIVDIQGGVTRNWLTQIPTFNRNDPADYTWAVYSVGAFAAAVIFAFRPIMRPRRRM